MPRHRVPAPGAPPGLDLRSNNSPAYSGTACQRRVRRRAASRKAG